VSCTPLLWYSVQSRLPLYDGTLDIVHSVNSIKYLPPLEFEELLYEWDRVLRAGQNSLTPGLSHKSPVTCHPSHVTCHPS